MAREAADAATSFWSRQQSAVVLGVVLAFFCHLLNHCCWPRCLSIKCEGRWRLLHSMGATVQPCADSCMLSPHFGSLAALILWEPITNTSCLLSTLQSLEL